MESPLSILVDNLAEGIHKIKCKTRGIKCEGCECSFELKTVKVGLIIIYKCLCYS